MQEEENKVLELLSLNVNDHTAKKGKLTYLSWSWAMTEMLKAYPDMTYKIERTEDGKMYRGDPEVGYMVNTSVTAGGITREMWLPVMDYRNQTILKPNIMEINKTIARCLTKNFAAFGLGLYIYAGEDLPEKRLSKKEDENDEEATKLKELKRQIIEICNNLGGTKNKDLLAMIKNPKFGNPNGLKTVDAAEAYIVQLKKLKPVK